MGKSWSEGAKALIYYITDYITKVSLPAHIGLAALLYAINRTREKYEDVPNWEHTKQAGALTILVNSMMARQEIATPCPFGTSPALPIVSFETMTREQQARQKA